MPQEDDFLLRSIRQLREAVARLAGLRARPDEHDRELKRAWDMLDVPRDLVLRADRDTLRALVADREQRESIAALLDEEASVVVARQPELAARMTERALLLRSLA